MSVGAVPLPLPKSRLLPYEKVDPLIDTVLKEISELASVIVAPF